MARLEAALEQEAPNSDQEDQISPEEACEATVMDLSANQRNSHSPGFSRFRDLKTFWHGLVTLLPFERLVGPETWKGDPGKS